jgi:pyruvate carboxylase subunit B
MKYIVEIEGRSYEVEVEGERIRLDGRSVVADLRDGGDATLRHLVLDGRSHTVGARPSGVRGRWDLIVDGRRLPLTVLDERRRAIRDVAGVDVTSSGPLQLTAPMPGLIVAVQVDEGAVVAEGQGVVVIEAMKMENEIKSEVGGRVTDVRVAAGQAVEKGEVLLVIEPVGGGD